MIRGYPAIVSTHLSKSRETQRGGDDKTAGQEPGRAREYAERAHEAAERYVRTCGAPATDPAPALLLFATAALVDTPPDRATVPALLKSSVELVELLRTRYGDSAAAEDLVDRLRTRRSHGRGA